MTDSLDMLVRRAPRMQSIDRRPSYSNNSTTSNSILSTSSRHHNGNSISSYDGGMNHSTLHRQSSSSYNSYSQSGGSYDSSINSFSSKSNNNQFANELNTMMNNSNNNHNSVSDSSSSSFKPGSSLKEALADTPDLSSAMHSYRRSKLMARHINIAAHILLCLLSDACADFALSTLVLKLDVLQRFQCMLDVLCVKSAQMSVCNDIFVTTLLIYCVEASRI